MANIKSAKKRVRVIEKKTAQNARVKGHVKEALRAFDDAVAEGDLEKAAEKRTAAEKELKQAAAKGALNKYAASRKVSRITKKLNAAKETAK